MMQGGRPSRFTDKKPTRYFSNKQEKQVAKAVGGKQVANSGASRFAKGDVRIEDKSCLIECKTCTKEQKSFAIKKEWLEKNREEAFAMGKQYSALAFDFGSGTNYYVVTERMFKEWLEGIDKH